ncbi:MAG: hypothetical protein AAGI37_10805 [Planctomycetota bacterium]
MSEALIHGDTDLVLPDQLLALISKGIWPTSDNSQRQNLKPIYRNKHAYKDRFEMDTLFLYPPPFVLVSEDIVDGDHFWKDKALTQYFGQSLTHGIEPELAVILGDFGPGTDAIFILDYQFDLKNPQITGMDYGEVSNQKGWTQLANNIDEFCEVIGLS